MASSDLAEDGVNVLLVSLEDAGNKTGADTLDLVRARFFSVQDRAFVRLDTEDLDLRVLLLQEATHASDGTAGALAADEGGNLSGSLLPDFRTSGSVMNLLIVFCVELISIESIRNITHQLNQLSLGALDAELHRSQDEFCAKSADENAALQTHVLGHHNDAAVPSGGTDEGETNTGVATCALENCRFSRSDLAGLFSFFDD